MPRYIAAYIAALLVFCACDFVWIGVLMGDFYHTRLDVLLAPQPRMGGAVLFYLMYLVGVIVFGSLAGVRAGTWRSAAGHGALFGLIAYCTYDLTNYATLSHFPADLVVVDMIWGTVLSALGASVGYAVLRAIAPKGPLV
jgi:uncharacterized membrane protein